MAPVPCLTAGITQHRRLVWLLCSVAVLATARHQSACSATARATLLAAHVSHSLPALSTVCCEAAYCTVLTVHGPQCSGVQVQAWMLQHQACLLLRVLVHERVLA